MTVRIGVLGAARIVADALLAPASETDGVEVAAVAARDPQRARAYASEHSIPTVHDDYAALLADPEIDAVYIPLPAVGHAEWTIAAVRAGKHVLCEKPFTSNAASAQRVADTTAGSALVVMEAYHSHFHPFQRRIVDIARSGELGTITSARASFCAPIPPGSNIRWNLELGGGGLLDIGYYPVRLLRETLGEDPRVERARAALLRGVDRLVTATLRFENGARADVVSSMWSRRLYEMRFELRGEKGRLRVSYPYHPQKGAAARIDGPGGSRVERAVPRSTYAFQLEAFRDAIRDGVPVETDARAAVAQLQTLDAIYAAAGVPPRP